jgi:hypothetical protein
VSGRPKALAWYKVYCYLFSALNFYTAWHGMALVRDPFGPINRYKFLSDLAIDKATTDQLAFSVQAVGWSLVATGVVFGLIAFTLPLAPDTKKTWSAHLVHILFGATSCVLAPLCIPLFFAWLRPEVRRWFGVPARD